MGDEIKVFKSINLYSSNSILLFLRNHYNDVCSCCLEKLAINIPQPFPSRFLPHLPTLSPFTISLYKSLKKPAVSQIGSMTETAVEQKTMQKVMTIQATKKPCEKM